MSRPHIYREPEWREHCGPVDPSAPSIGQRILCAYPVFPSTCQAHCCYWGPGFVTDMSSDPFDDVLLDLSLIHSRLFLLLTLTNLLSAIYFYAIPSSLTVVSG